MLWPQVILLFTVTCLRFCDGNMFLKECYFLVLGNSIHHYRLVFVDKKSIFFIRAAQIWTLLDALWYFLCFPVLLCTSCLTVEQLNLLICNADLCATHFAT